MKDEQPRRSKSICFISASHNSDDVRMYQKEAIALADDGWKVSILVIRKFQRPHRNDVNLIVFDPKTSSRLLVILKASALFRKKALALDSDIYQIQSPECLPLGLLLKIKGKKVVYDAEEDLPNLILVKHWIPIFARRSLRILCASVLRIIFNYFDAVITPHPHYHDQLRNARIKSELITNYPKKPNQSPLSYEQGYVLRGRIVCYAGTVYRYSNQESILQALMEIPNVEYHIAGTIDAESLKIIKSHSAAKKVKFAGYLASSQLDLFYSKARIGIVLIDELEYLGGIRGTLAVNKFFEYMAAGIPVVCSNTEIWSDIVRKHQCGIAVDPKNTNQIRDAISYLLNNEEIAYEMGRNGYIASLKTFNWTAQSEQYKKLIETVARIHNPSK